MRVINLNYSFSHVPPVMRRGRHALILLQDKNGGYVLGHKKVYPEGIVRMVGGGIDPNEDPQLGASRELQEELGIAVSPQQLTPLVEIIAQVEGPENEYTFITFVYFYQLIDEALHPADDIEAIRTLNRNEFKELIERFRNLPTELFGTVKDPEYQFRWSDYGSFYAEVHASALEEADRTHA